jgi:hypothetical protein
MFHDLKFFEKVISYFDILKDKMELLIFYKDDTNIRGNNTLTSNLFHLVIDLHSALFYQSLDDYLCQYKNYYLM